MTKVRTNARSFAGGEVSGEFYGRVDQVKYATGLAACRNFIPLPHGPVMNRPGTRYVNACRYADKAARLIPFTYSDSQTMAIELGAGYARFHTQGGTLLAGAAPWSAATSYTVGDAVTQSGVTYYCKTDNTNHNPATSAFWVAMGGPWYELPLPYTEADLFDIRYVQSADVLTLTHENYPPAEVRRYGPAKWVYSVISFGATVAAPAGVRADATPATTDPGAPLTQSYVVTALGADGAESLASAPAQGASYTFADVTWSEGKILLAGDKRPNWSVGDPARLSGSDHDGDYVVDSVTHDTIFGLELTTITLRVSGGDVASFSSGGTSGSIIQMGVRNNLFDTGAYNIVRWSPVAGATRYYVYKESNGLYGLIGQTKETLFQDDDITADISRTPPSNANPFSGAGNYPRAVSYYEQRRSFAGTVNKPQNFWLTKSATESNLNQSIPTRDDDAIAYRLAAQKINTIQHLVPLQALVLLTSSAVWRITSVNTDALTPASTSVKQQSNVGASNVQPVLASENMIYVASRGGHLREVSYSWQSSGYVSADLSRFNPDLFDGKDVVDMAFAQAPYPIVWCVSSDGRLLSLTYVPEEQVTGMARHDTDGAFESVTVVPEDSVDAVYVVVRRVVAGQTVRYVERFESRQTEDPAQAYIVDCGARYDGAPVTAVTSGLSHLEGKTVSILADGAVHPPRIVTDGAVTLDHEASVIAIGLPIEADLKTLPVVLEIDGMGQGRAKSVNKVWLRVSEASGVFAGPGFDDLTQYKQRMDEPYGTPPAPLTGELEITLDGGWSDGGQICIRQSDPLPVTVVSLTAEVQIGG
ncbi:hypothetical protein [Asticcacaulis solisilvae]|uniref:hypothetical protein n=1 Tax=Asticcacaulis solisilvae TaxID=1217274 RepID=UPI003FD6E7BD